jgi:phosphomannomutase
MNLLETAKAWLAQDPDLVTAGELRALIESEDHAELESRFSSRLEFGTAGLRGELGAGPNRMNRIVVAQAAHAIAGFLLNNRSAYMDPSGQLSVVIGYDGRVNSDVFAKDSAEIFAGAGINVSLFDSPVPTPVACFTGARLKSSATIVVTASHNPPRDNGYKVYLGGPLFGSQLVPPQDKEIAALITQTASTLSFAEIPKSSNYQMFSESEVQLYQDRAAELVPISNPARGELAITYTAMHGVGFKVIEPILSALGFELNSVAQQQEPDGSFPTVSFPNPEEPGAMDLSFAHAQSHNSDLILANDPDADRLAVGVRTATGYQMLTGDEVGLLLAELIAARGTKGSLANSIVSASLEPLARHYGVHYEQTLTGFKWISKVANLSYGYEEALGYCVDPSHTPDKDGITAAVLIAELASALKAKNQTLLDLLAELAGRYGHLKTAQVSIRVTDLSLIGKIMAGVRANPLRELLKESVEFEDLALGLRLGPTEGVILRTESMQVIIRPSGTEPKLKCYLQVRGSTSDTANSRLEELKAFASEYLKSLS